MLKYDDIREKTDGDHKRLKVWEIIILLLLILFIIAVMLFLI